MYEEEEKSKHHHHRPHHKHHGHPFRPRANLEHFYVITPITNSARYQRRYELYWKFADMVEACGVKLITVECAFGNRPFMVTERHNPYHVQVRSFEELWLKENMCNLGFKRAREIDPHAREVAWVDADCFPMIPPIEWFEETWHALQHYEFVQMWEYLMNYGPQNQPIGSPQMSFMAVYEAAGYEVPKTKNVRHTLAGHSGQVSLGRSGLAWAANLDALDKVGGLIDFCILGSGDWHMAHGLVGAMQDDNNEFKNLSAYSKALLEWQNRAERWVKRDVGLVKTTVGHWWHGAKKHRRYGDRGNILIKNQYDPHTDIKYDSQGLLALETHEARQIRLRDQIRAYFHSRHEDSIDV